MLVKLMYSVFIIYKYPIKFLHDNLLSKYNSINYLFDKHICVSQVEQKLQEGFIEQWNLHMRHVKQTDEGTYECQVTDKIPIRTFVYLHVKRECIHKTSAKIQCAIMEYPRNLFIILLVCLEDHKCRHYNEKVVFTYYTNIILLLNIIIHSLFPPFT